MPEHNEEEENRTKSFLPCNFQLLFLTFHRMQRQNKDKPDRDKV